MPEAPNSAVKAHRKALEFIESATANADAVQRQVLLQILTQNASAEYLHRHGIASPDLDSFRQKVPLVTYEDIQSDIKRIADGDTSPILSGHPISEFLTRLVSLYI